MLNIKKYANEKRIQSPPSPASRLGRLYDFVTGDEDARVCKDIPDAACNDMPWNFFIYLFANTLTKIGDELASAKLVLPWLLSALGSPAAFAGFLVPIRESGSLLPQLVVAAYIRRFPIRKGFWILGSILQALALFGMALAAITLEGAAAGWTVLGLLTIFSLARGVCSVSAKDVLGKTVSKTRRGTLMGYAAALSGIATLALGLYIQFFAGEDHPLSVFLFLLGGAGILWLLAALIFAGTREKPGATEGGGNALYTALGSFSLLKTDRDFRHFVATRTLLLSTALSQPFYVMLAEQQSKGKLAGLGLLIVASGLAGSLSAPVWGRLGDRSSRLVMAAAASIAGILGLLVFVLIALDATFMSHDMTYALLFLIIAIAHSGARLGRKTYLLDLATPETRAAYVALSNTLIGAFMLVGGVFGVLGDVLGTSYVILALAVLALIAAASAVKLKEVE